MESHQEFVFRFYLLLLFYFYYFERVVGWVGSVSCILSMFLGEYTFT